MGVPSSYPCSPPFLLLGFLYFSPNPIFLYIWSSCKPFTGYRETATPLLLQWCKSQNARGLCAVCSSAESCVLTLTPQALEPVSPSRKFQSLRTRNPGTVCCTRAPVASHEGAQVPKVFTALAKPAQTLLQLGADCRHCLQLLHGQIPGYLLNKK